MRDNLMLTRKCLPWFPRRMLVTFMKTGNLGKGLNGMLKFIFRPTEFLGQERGF